MTVKHADSVFESLELEGEWYLPETPDVRCYGMLTYDVVGTNHLKLWGKLDEQKGIGQNYSIVHGITGGGVKITIFNANLVGLNTKNSGVTTHHSKLYILKFWIGEHFLSIGDVKLKCFSFGINNLEGWHDLEAFSSEEQDDKISIKYIRPANILFFEDEYVKISLCYAFSHRESTPQVRVDLEHAARIIISAKNNKMLYYINNENKPSIEYYFNHITNFFWVVMGREVFTYSHQAIVETIIKKVEELGKEPPLRVDEKRKFPLDIEYYWARSIEARELKKVNIYWMIFPFDFFQNDLRKLMIEWFKQESVITVAMDSYIEFCNKINSFTKATLPLLIYAIEGLHRILYPKLDEKHRKKAIDFILQCPDDIKKDIDKRIMKWCPLPERLHKLLKEYKEIFPVFYRERVKIVDDLISARNNISHGKIGKMSLDFNLQFVYARFLSLLLVAMFMDVAGMKKEKIAERFASLPRLNEINKKMKSFYTQDRI